MAGKRTRRPIALSHGVKDAPTSKAIRQLEGVARDLQTAVDGLSSGSGSGVPTTRRINTAAPLSGGGDLSADRTLAVAQFASGAAGVVPASGGGTANFLRADGTWAAPAGGVPASRLINTTAPLTGGGDLSADRTLGVSQFTPVAAGIVPASGGGAGNYLRADGTWAAPAGASSGGLFARFLSSSVPTQANTGFSAWMNQPTGATVTDASSGMNVYAPSQSSTVHLALLSQAAPTAPYSITILLSALSTANAAALFGWSDGTKVQSFVFNPVGDSTNNWLSLVNYTNVTTSSSTPWFMSANSGGAWLWLRLRDDGTTVYWDLSTTGEEWLTAASTAKSAGFLGTNGYSHIVFGVNAFASAAYAKLLSWAVA